jgi:hypothetical protein
MPNGSAMRKREGGEANPQPVKESVMSQLQTKGTKMKTSTFVLGAAVLAGLAVISTVNAAMVAGTTMAFQSGDFTVGNAYTAKKTMLVPNTGACEVFDFANAYNSNDYGNPNSIRPTNSAFVSYVTWKLTTPTSNPITSFTWGISNLIPIGYNNETATLTFSYSTDNTNWIPLYVYQNIPDNLVGLGAQTYAATLPTSSTVLYLRWITNADAGQGLYENPIIWANEAATSYFQVTAVPEPAAVSLLALGGLTLLRRRR